MDKILLLLGLIIIAVSVILVFDARRIATKLFSNGEKNEATKSLKMVGFIIALLGMCIIAI